MADISVIIPCYNVEAYIDRCMESIEKQSIGIENLEIILVNDASADGTLDKLKTWEKKYPEHIMVITYEENIRQGGARNVGLQYATAEYVGFIDSDDWVEPDMYELLFQKMCEGHYDVVRGKFARTDEYGIQIMQDGDSRRDQEYEFPEFHGYYKGSMEDVGDNGEYGSVCTAIYRKSLIIENEIYFPEKLAYEDNYWMSVLSFYIKSCYIEDKIVYHYMTNPTSTTTAANGMHHLDRLKIEEMKLERYQKMGIFDREEFREEIERDFVQMYYLNTFFILFTRFEKVSASIVNQMIKTVWKWFPHWDENHYLTELDEMNVLLLQLLKLKRELSDEEVNEIGRLYVAVWEENMR